MVIGLVMVFKTSFSIRKLATYRGFLTLTLFILHYAISFYFPLNSFNGIKELLILSKKIKGLHLGENMSPLKNTFAIAFIFALLILSQITYFSLASFFKSMFVNPGLLLSKSTYHKSNLSKASFMPIFIRV